MSTPRKTPKELREESYEEGYACGYESARKFFLAKAVVDKKEGEGRKAQIELMKAVTTLVSVAGQAVQSLSGAFDTMEPRND